MSETMEEYFVSYENTDVHRLMLNDKIRTNAYKDAILKNSHLFKGKIAMDVGAGTGILSLFMAKAGAKKVIAIEASSLANTLPQIAQDNGYGDVIEVYQTKIEDFTNDQKVDIIVSEWMGFYLLHESMLDSVIYARDNFLTSDGVIFPSEARIYACPCSLTKLYKDELYYWNNIYGFNMKAIQDYSFKSKQTKPEICHIKCDDLLANPICIKTFDLNYITIDDLSNFDSKVFVGITTSGNYDGLAIWFDVDFDGVKYEGDEFEAIGEVVTLSTSPFKPETHWKQTVIVLAYDNQENSKNETTKIQNTQNVEMKEITEKKSETKEINTENVVIKENIENFETKNTETFETKEKKIKIIKENTDNFETETNSDTKISNHFLEKDEVIGWSLSFQKSDNPRHYSLSYEGLDPLENDHPIPCSCPMPKCLIISKFTEDEGITYGDM